MPATGLRPHPPQAEGPAQGWKNHATKPKGRARHSRVGTAGHCPSPPMDDKCSPRLLNGVLRPREGKGGPGVTQSMRGTAGPRHPIPHTTFLRGQSLFKETKLPLLSFKGPGMGRGKEVKPPEELHAAIHVTRGGIISPGKNLIKSPPLPDPRGIRL